MPYNQKTAIENQKIWLRQQIKDAKRMNHPNIAKRAQETLASIERKEKAAKEANKKIAAFNKAYEEKRKREKLEHLKIREDGLKKHINGIETDFAYGVYSGENKKNTAKYLNELKILLKEVQEEKNSLERKRK